MFYFVRAIHSLKDAGDFGYITGGSKTGDRVRVAIVAELGRCGDPDMIREFAARICALRPSVKDALTLIRTWRNGGAAPGDAAALADEIARLVRDYTLRHPATTNDQVREAMEIVGKDYPLPWPDGEVTEEW
jgi:hypothetical protein